MDMGRDGQGRSGASHFVQLSCCGGCFVCLHVWLPVVFAEAGAKTRPGRPVRRAMEDDWGWGEMDDDWWQEVVAGYEARERQAETRGSSSADVWRPQAAAMWEMARTSSGESACGEAPDEAPGDEDEWPSEEEGEPLSPDSEARALAYSIFEQLPPEVQEADDPQAAAKALLGLPPDASDDDIGSTFRKIAVKSHPDKLSGPNADSDTLLHFMQAKVAKEVLLNQWCQEYMEYLKSERCGGGTPRRPPRQLRQCCSCLQQAPPHPAPWRGSRRNCNRRQSGVLAPARRCASAPRRTRSGWTPPWARLRAVLLGQCLRQGGQSERAAERTRCRARSSAGRPTSGRRCSARTRSRSCPGH